MQNSEQTQNDKEAKDRLKQALAINKKLAQAYYLKEELREIWRRIDKQSAERQLMDWVHKARSTTIEVLKKMAATLLKHRFGSVLTDLKARGVEDILITVTDNLNGFTDTIKTIFPQSTTQICVVHQIRNSCKYVVWKDMKVFTADMKEIYTSVNREQAASAP